MLETDIPLAALVLNAKVVFPIIGQNRKEIPQHAVERWRQVKGLRLDMEPGYPATLLIMPGKCVKRVGLAEGWGVGYISRSSLAFFNKFRCRKMAGMPPPKEWYLERAMKENRFGIEPKERIPDGLRARSGWGKKPAGPDIRVMASPGVVATRGEIQEELDRRRTYGCVRNSL